MWMIKPGQLRKLKYRHWCGVFDDTHNIKRRWMCIVSIAEKVKTIIVEQLGVEEDEVTNDASFVDNLGADSLDIVELVMALEEEFELEIPDEDAEQIKTVGEAITYIQNRQ